jgi:macrolide-specific efflux system membrane fusion protein
VNDALPFRSSFRVTLACALAFTLVLAACGKPDAGDDGDDQGLADRASGPVAVQRGEVQDLVAATGILQPHDYVDVGAQLSGQVKKLHVSVGDPVKQGQLLAEIDAEQAAARVDADRATLRAQNAMLAQQQAALDKVVRDRDRQRRLFADGAVTAEIVQNAETNVRVAQAQVSTLKAQIDQAEANLRVEEASLRQTRIYAPMAGAVVSLSVSEGQTLNATQQAPVLMRIADLSTMTVQAQVSEADVARLRVGMPVYFTTLGGNGTRWRSTVRKVEPTPTVSNNVVLYNALFDVPNPDMKLLPQMTAQVFFVVAEAGNALTVPVTALQFRSDESAKAARRHALAQVRTTDGDVQAREVLVGVSNRVQAEIVEGLAEGEQIIVP